MDGEMAPEGVEGGGEDSNLMVFSTAEYPQLEGLEAGADIPKITHTGNRVKEVADGSVTVEMGPCEFEVGNKADRSLKEMVGEPAMAGGASAGSPDTEY